MSVSEVENLYFTEFRVRPPDRENSYPKSTEWVHFVNNMRKTIKVPTTQPLTSIFQIPDNQDIHYYQKKTFFITVDKLRPIRPWKAARQGTTKKFAGMLSKSIPEFSEITVDQMDHIYDQFRKRE